MLLLVEKEEDIKAGDYYEDCAYHPCLCIRVDDDEVSGISLIDGLYPRSCSVFGCAIRKLSRKESQEWKFHGPSDIELEKEHQWWFPNNKVAEFYAPKENKNA